MLGCMAGMKEFGIELRQRYEAKGLDGQRLAVQVGVSPSLISDFVTGKKKNPPTPDLLGRLSAELAWPEVAMLRRMGYLSTAIEADGQSTQAEHALVPIIRQFDWSEEKLRAAVAAVRAIGAMGNRPG